MIEAPGEPRRFQPRGHGARGDLRVVVEGAAPPGAEQHCPVPARVREGQDVSPAAREGRRDERHGAGVVLRQGPCVGGGRGDDRGDEGLREERRAGGGPEEGDVRRVDLVIRVKERSLRPIGLVITGLPGQHRIEPAAPAHLLFLRLGAAEEASARVLGRGEIQEHDAPRLPRERLRGVLRRRVEDLDPRRSAGRARAGEERLHVLRREDLRPRRRGGLEIANVHPFPAGRGVSALFNDVEDLECCRMKGGHESLAWGTLSGA